MFFWLCNAYILQASFNFTSNIFTFYYRDDIESKGTNLYITPFVHYGIWRKVTLVKPDRKTHVRIDNIFNNSVYNFYGKHGYYIRLLTHIADKVLWDKLRGQLRGRKWYIILDICAYINNILYNIIFFPMYLIMLLVFWPKELLAWEWFTYNWEGKKTSLLESLRSSPLACDCHIKNTRHNTYSLLIFNFILLFINLFLGYYVLLFIFVVNSPLRMCRFNDQFATIIRSNYISYIDIRKRELHVQQVTFTNLITGKKMSKPWHFLDTVEHRC